MVSTISYAALAAAAMLSATTEAHQTVYIPAPTFTTTDKTTKTNPIAFLENQGYSPTEDVAGFLKKKGVKTLRDFMDNKANYKNDAAGATFECGYTDPNGKRQPIPANGMMRSSGFTHEGPCEVWIDSTRVLGSSSGNCNKDIPGAPVSYKIDFSVCKGDCLIRWYWLGKRLIGKKWSWQVYKECIPITAGTKRSMDDEEIEAAEAAAAGDVDSHSYRMYDNSTESNDAYYEAHANLEENDAEEDTTVYRSYENDDEEAAAAEAASTPEEPTESYRMSEYENEEETTPEESD